MDGFAIFMGTLVAVNLLPGPDMLLVVSTAAGQGTRQALSTAFGLALARACHVTFAAIGLAQLLQASPLVFDTVRWAGAAYLVWLGLSVALARGDADATGVHAESRLGRCFLRGFLTNITNPKALIFLSVVLPQSVHPELGSIYPQFAWLGTIAVGTAFLFDLSYIVLARQAARLTPRSSRFARFRRWTIGGLLIAFSARLAFS